jgi:hypothetical protein
MDSYTVAIQFENDIFELDDNVVIFNVLNNNKSILIFEFENTVSVSQWTDFINNVQNDYSEREFSLIFQDMNGTTCMTACGEYFEVHVSDAGHGHSSLTVTLKKNQNLLDALHQIMTFVR